MLKDGGKRVAEGRGGARQQITVATHPQGRLVLVRAVADGQDHVLQGARVVVRVKRHGVRPVEHKHKNGHVQEGVGVAS
jgi:hypothetical protein